LIFTIIAERYYALFNLEFSMKIFVRRDNNKASTRLQRSSLQN